MKALEKIFDKNRHHFEKGGKFEKFYYVFEATETFHFTPKTTTPKKGAHIKDAIDLKRLMMTVVIAMIPVLLFGMWNTGHQHFLATGVDATFWEKFGLGAKLVLPIVLVSYAAGGAVEAVFAIWRKHPINEGFLVTGMLIPLCYPVTAPLWMVAVSAIFAVLIAKEIFGGTGMNVLNVALTARAFLFFAYPAYMSGEIWTYLGGEETVDGYSGATALAMAFESNSKGMPVEASFANGWSEGMFTPLNMFLGAIPGSIAETSTLAILVGAAILIITGVGSWQIIVSVFLGGAAMALFLNVLPSIGVGTSNQYMQMDWYYHLIIGGFAFGAVYMATDPVSASHTSKGKWIYGFLIGIVCVLIRVFNPAYPEGMMLAILLMNVFAPLIDYYVVQGNKKRRLSRATV